MRYLAALDYLHLDNGMFLTSLAQAISKQKNVQPIIIHSDSEYTERVIQTGVMREDAKIRSIKDLNHRLIALLADEGISAIGINGYQRELITIQNNTLKLDQAYFNTLPKEPVLVISSLVLDSSTGGIIPLSLPTITGFLFDAISADELFIFSQSEADEIMETEDIPSQISASKLNSTFWENKIPAEFHQFAQPMRFTTAQKFHKIPDLSSTMLISP